MITSAFSLFDTKTGIYGTPFFMIHQQMAIRACIDLVQDLSTTVGRHPADYTLCQVGSFDDATGIFTADAPQHLLNLVSLVPTHAPTSLPFPPPVGSLNGTGEAAIVPHPGKDF